MVLDRDDRAGLLGRADNGVRVDGLDGVHVDNARLHALIGQDLRGLKALREHHAGGDDRHVLTLTQGVGLAEHELVVHAVIRLDAGAVIAQVDGALQLDELGQHLAKLHAVERLHDRHVGDGAEHADVLIALMRAAVDLGLNAGGDANEHGVELAVRKGDRHLIDDAAAHERAKGLGERLFAAHGKSGCHADHVGLGDADVKAALGECLVEILCRRILAGVGIDQTDPVISAGHLDQSVAKHFLQIFFCHTFF